MTSISVSRVRMKSRVASRSFRQRHCLACRRTCASGKALDQSAVSGHIPTIIRRAPADGDQTTMSKISIHVGIVSWEGRHTAASRIASELVDHADNLTVVYSNSADEIEDGKGEWIQVDNAKFFGPKFKTLVERVSEDVFLLIQSDAEIDDWVDVLESCRQAFSEPNNIGYWGPEVHVTPFPPEIVMLSEGSDNTIDCVNVDAIVCAMSREVYEQLRAYPFENNNLGWGVGLTASAAAMVAGSRVVMDRGVLVSHPPSRGYDGSNAKKQQDRMLLEIPAANQALVRLIQAYCHKSGNALAAESRPTGLRQSLKALAKRGARSVSNTLRTRNNRDGSDDRP